MISFKVNGKDVKVDADPNTPLLWVIRDHLKLTGTKYGCGISQCGACTVHLDGRAVRSCVTTVSMASGRNVTTIEGLAQTALGKTVQTAWEEVDVPQCGYCQSGQIMAATALLQEHPNPTEAQIVASMDGNLCRCGTYNRIRAAIHKAAELQGGAK
ncbi:MAG TPA: (2Fe-2S)-binding protein [Gallionella sp.]|nr:(2Fe-2S)-binding protein [Gallionella sp.]